MKTTDICMVRGDTLEFEVRFEGLEGDLASASFTCKKNLSDANAIFSKTLSNGITKVSDGVYNVRVAPADTQNVKEGWYFHDLEVTIGSDVYTVIIGRIKIIADVTN